MLITPLTRNALLSVERCAEDLQVCTQKVQKVSEDIGESTVAKLVRPRNFFIVFAIGLVATQLISKKPTSASSKKSKAGLFSGTQVFSFVVTLWVMLSKTRSAEKAVGENPIEPVVRD